MTIVNVQRHRLIVDILFVMLISAVIIVKGQTLQKITFYTSRDKEGPSQSFSSAENISPTSLTYTAGSYCVEEGLWIITIRTGDTDIKEWMGGKLGGENCINRPQEGRKYIAVRPVGAINLEESVLTLFPQVRWETEDGKLEIEDDEDEEDNNLTFLSWVLTGSQSYEIFPEAEFGGESVCLQANAPSHLTYGIASNFSALINYRSSRRGCGLTGDGDGGNRTTTERGTGGSVSYLSNSISKFFHFTNLVLLYYSRKIVF